MIIGVWRSVGEAYLCVTMTKSATVPRVKADCNLQTFVINTKALEQNGHNGDLALLRLNTAPP